jgi:ABC-type multidrug transport system fused ATPase/permease subunit
VRLKGILVTLVIVLGALFAVTNWQALMEGRSVSLLFFSVIVPLGMVLLVTAIAIAVTFFVISLVDRAGQLRQITHLEQQLEKAQKKLEQKRLEELEGLEERLSSRLDGLTDEVRDVKGIERRIEEQQLLLREVFEQSADKLEERVLLVRNELAADIHQVEESLATPKQLESGREGSS